MPTYIGFSTIDAGQVKTTNILNGIDNGGGSITKPVYSGKKYTLTDSPLVIRDFINALNIPLGSKVGQPGYGTSLWDFVFEPNTGDVQNQLQNEIRRVASQDPRLDINYLKVYPQNNGILLEMQFSINPFNNPQTLNIFFDKESSTAGLS